MNAPTLALFAAAAVIGVLPGVVIAGPTLQDRNANEAHKIYVKIEAPETISEAVEHQIIGQLKRTKNVSLVTDPDDADTIFHFNIHEIRMQSDRLIGYAIVFIWTWREGVRNIEKNFGDEWSEEDHDAFAQFVSGLSFYATDEFYTCEVGGLKERLTSMVTRIDTQIVNGN